MLKRLNMSQEELSEFLSMFVPMFVEQILISGIALFITNVVKGSGMEAVAAVNLLNALAFLFQQVFAALGVGVTVVVAQFRGRGDSKATGNAAMQSVMLVLILALGISLACFALFEPLLTAILQQSEPLVYEYGRIYLTYYVLALPFVAVYTISAAAIRGSGHPRISLWATLIQNGLYALLASISVYWLNAGLKGIGISLLVSSALAAVVGLYLLWRGNAHMRIERLVFKIDRTVARPVFRVGVPLMVEALLFQGGRLITQTYAVPYGTAGMAANGISNNIHTLTIVPGQTAAAAAPAIVGRYCGQGDFEGAKRKGMQFIWLATVLLVFSSLLTFSLLRPLVASMTDVLEIQTMIHTIMLTSCIAVPLFWPASFITPAIIRSSGDGKFTSIVSILSMITMRLTISYVLTHVFKIGVIGIWLGMYSDWLVRIAFFFPRLRSGKWLQFRVLDE